MTNDVIEKFIETKVKNHHWVNIHFKQRASVKGMFLQGGDYEELKSKNFWRIVTQQHIPDWKKTGNINLAKIFSGSEFTKLTPDAN